MQINCKGKLIDLSKPHVMGILNITTDSFYDGGRNNQKDQALRQTEKMLSEGATFIDVGGISTRPGSDAVSEEEELTRVVPMVEELVKEFPEILISIDTYRAKVAKETVEAGAVIINDISAGLFDDKLFETVAKLQVPYILMHIKGSPKDMQQNPQYENITLEVNQFLAEKIDQLRNLGINDIILDPGFGFGKNVEQNYTLMKEMDLIGFGQYPLLVGISRKSMIRSILGNTPDEALNGTSILNFYSLQKNAKILRVHDVKEAMEAIKLWEVLKEK